MSLRVIAGRARGTRLRDVPGGGTRPMMDRVKEALFSIIGRDIIEASFLDFFAGTGSVGIEALSRGARYVLFIELNRQALKTIRLNLKRASLEERAVVRQRDAFALLARPPEEAFDFLFIAPPQYRGLWRSALEALDGNPAWHHHKTTVIAQIDPSEWDEDMRLLHLRETDRRKYGRTMLLFFAFSDAEAGQITRRSGPG